MKLKKGGKGITAVLLAGTLCVAVYLNWSFAQQAPAQTTSLTVEEPALETAAEEGESAEVFEPFDADSGVAETAATDPDAKNYGEAQLVSISQDTGSQFFDEARLNRTKTRDEALDALKKSLKSASLTEEEKSELTDRLTEQVNNITAESELETQIKAKGFADCVVFLNEGKANITVMTENDALTSEEVTQIRDVVLRKCSGLSAQDITVVEVK